MNNDDVADYIRRMQKADAAGDYESAYEHEDDLLHAFIAAIAQGTFEGNIQKAAAQIDSALLHNNPHW